MGRLIALGVIAYIKSHISVTHINSSFDSKICIEFCIFDFPVPLAMPLTRWAWNVQQQHPPPHPFRWPHAPLVIGWATCLIFWGGGGGEGKPSTSKHIYISWTTTCTTSLLQIVLHSYTYDLWSFFLHVCLIMWVFSHHSCVLAPLVWLFYMFFVL